MRAAGGGQLWCDRIRIAEAGRMVMVVACRCIIFCCYCCSTPTTRILHITIIDGHDLQNYLYVCTSNLESVEGKSMAFSLARKMTRCPYNISRQICSHVEGEAFDFVARWTDGSPRLTVQRYVAAPVSGCVLCCRSSTGGLRRHRPSTSLHPSHVMLAHDGPSFMTA